MTGLEASPHKEIYTGLTSKVPTISGQFHLHVKERCLPSTSVPQERQLRGDIE